MRKSSRILLIGLGLTCVAAFMRGAPPRGVKIDVHGVGWWQDRQLELSLQRLSPTPTTTMDANAIEDAAFLVFSALAENGFLQAKIEVTVVPPDGGEQKFGLDAALTESVPRPLEGKTVKFDVRRGVRYYIDVLRVNGLHAFPEQTARQFFRGESTLFTTKSGSAYSPARLSRGLSNLQSELRQRGYAEAEVRAEDVISDDRTGATRVVVEVNEGAIWRVSSLAMEGATQPEVKLDTLQHEVGRPWSAFWDQDVAGEIRQIYYRAGYPDVVVKMRHEAEALDAARNEKPVPVVAEITAGTKAKIGAVRFEGIRHTHEQILRRRVRLEPGGPVNPLATERARYRLSRLGVFDNVDVRYDPDHGPVRDTVFSLKERELTEINLLAGWGSYEELRGGVEVRQYNLFGLAHQTRLLLVQSMKSTRGDYSYTVPEIFGESVDGTVKLFGLQRKEPAFIRQEYGGSVMFNRTVPWIRADATAGYTFQALRNRDNVLATSASDNKQVTVASVDVELNKDERDNPLRPHRGYRWFSRVEAAERAFGGEVNYERFELGASYHTGWGEGRWVHLGFSHGFITTLGANDASLPVNKRFYPGGDNSIRGYQEGEAAPRDASGRFIGAKAYMLFSAELEQALTPKWSGVVFYDALGTAVRLSDYPFSEKLHTVGLGVRYQTLVGPIRLEYGHNLNRRPGDPAGTLLISVGVPF